MIARLARVVFVASLSFVAVVTLSPIEFRPETGFSPNRERFAAFLWLGALLALGFPRSRLRALLVLVGVAGVLELCQNLVPGRHGRWLDFDVKAAGALVGAAAASLVVGAWRSRPGVRSIDRRG